MNQPQRWLHSAPNPKIRDLLRAGLNDDPDVQALPRTLAALGLGAAVTLVSGTAAALAAEGAARGTFASAAAATSATGAAVATGSAASALVIGKWLAIGFLAGGVASAGLLVSQNGFGLRHQEAQHASPGTPAAMRAPLPARKRAGVAEPEPEAWVPALGPARSEVEVEPKPVGERSHNVTGGASPKRVTSPSKQPSRTLAEPAKASEPRGALAQEIAWIDAARRALSSGDVNRSLAELDAFERTRKLGVLDREAGLLRLDALRQKGDIDGARKVAERYLRAFPGDAHAPRLREFMSSTESKP